MRKIKDVLRLCWGQGLSKRKAARSCGVSRPAVDEYLRRAEAAGLCWPLPAGLDDGVLERLLFPPPPALPAGERGVPDWSHIHQELKRKGVTLFLLWQEYRQRHPHGYQYTWFCQHYRTWCGKLDLGACKRWIAYFRHHLANSAAYVQADPPGGRQSAPLPTERLPGTTFQLPDVLRIVHNVHFSVTVRTERDSVLETVGSPVSKPDDVVGLQERLVRRIGERAPAFCTIRIYRPLCALHVPPRIGSFRRRRWPSWRISAL